MEKTMENNFFTHRLFMRKSNIFIIVLIISALISSCASDSSTTSSYIASDKLPQEYTPKMAEKNGDIVVCHPKIINLEKLDDFIERFKEKKTNKSDMERIITYTVEGDALINDLIVTDKGIKLIIDYTRDKYGHAGIVKYNIADIYKKNQNESLFYMVKTDEKIEILLFSIDSKEAQPTHVEG